MQNARILAIGNALVDVIIDVADDRELETLSLPKGSMSLVDHDRAQRVVSHFKGAPIRITPGGSAANTVAALAALGSEVGYIGRIGLDDYGKVFENDMLAMGMRPLLQKAQEHTGTAITLMSSDYQRTFATYLGAASNLQPSELKIEDFTGYSYFHIEGYLCFNYELITKAVELAKKAGCRIAIDLASYNVVEDNLDFFKALLTQYADVVFANEEEAKAFTGLEGEAAACQIANYCDLAVVKLGAQGSIARRGNCTERVAAYPAQCRDTNGAGDGYAAGFLHGLSQERSIQDCLQMGSIVAAEVIETQGPRLSIQQWKTVATRMPR